MKTAFTTTRNMVCDCSSGHVSAGALWRLAVGAFVAVNSMVLSHAVNTSGPATKDTNVVRYVLLTATIGVLGLLGVPLIRSAAHELRRGRITIELLFLIGIGGALATSALSQYAGRGPVYYEVATVLLVIYTLGRHLTAETQKKVLGVLAESLPGVEFCEVVDSDDTAREVRVEDIQIGQQVRVHPGRAIPVDGTVRSGRALVRGCHLTGESFAVGKQPGDEVLAGSYVIDATLLVEVGTDGRDRRIDQIENLLLSAQARPGQSQRLANLLAAQFVPVVCGIACITFVVWWRMGSAESALFNALSVLLVACPCALGFATPVAVWATLARFSGGGVILRNSAAVEKLADTRVVIFDKTGTLTDQDAANVRLQILSGAQLTAHQVADCLVATEAASDHPITRVVASFAREHSVKGEALHLQVLPGVGLEAKVRLRPDEPNRTVRVGLLPWLERNVPSGSSGVIGMEVDGVPTAILHLEEQQVDGIKSAVEALGALGVRTVLLTGDNAERTRQIPIPERISGLSPEQKLAYVKAEQRSGRGVLFIGDGLNDAAAMAASNVSLAPDFACPLADAVADGIWRDRSFAPLIDAIDASRKAVQIIRSNLLIAVGYNSIGIGLAAFGFLHPVMAALLMTGSSLTVTWRALRLLESPVSIGTATVALEANHEGLA